MNRHFNNKDKGVDLPLVDRPELPDPDDLNDDRAKWANVALSAFAEETRTDDETAFYDLLVDLMHWAHRYSPEGFDEILERARAEYVEETSDGEVDEDDDEGGRQ